jgi:hypothetical protein
VAGGHAVLAVHAGDLHRRNVLPKRKTKEDQES